MKLKEKFNERNRDLRKVSRHFELFVYEYFKAGLERPLLNEAVDDVTPV